jgi:diguanylate cyclase (GGDEF)-like protein
MTGLYNRAYFEEAIASLEADRRDPISFIVIDLNGLKAANDSLGHYAGDQLIRRTAEVLRASIDDGYFTARIGGDEFIIVMPGAAEEAADEMMERVQSLEVMNNKFYRAPALSLSQGAATSTPELSLQRVISLADDAMYQNKGLHHRRRKSD